MGVAIHRKTAQAAALTLGLAWCGWASAEYPKPQGRVDDFAGVLDDSAKATLNQLINDVDQRTTVEIAVVTLQNLHGEPIESYANGLFRAWGIGKKGKDNGVLLLVVVQDHKMRIEVGYGLEALLPDGLCGQIIREDLRPAFKRGHYADGLVAGTRQLAAIIEGDKTTVARRPHQVRYSSPSSHQIESYVKIIFLVFFGLFVGVGAFLLGAGLGSKVGGMMIGGSFFGGVPFLISLGFPIPHSILPVLGLGVIALGYFAGRHSPQSFRQGQSSSKSNGWIMGGGSSSHSSGGGGHSSGGFGGGSSGGGGASGSW